MAHKSNDHNILCQGLLGDPTGLVLLGGLSDPNGFLHAHDMTYGRVRLRTSAKFLLASNEHICWNFYLANVVLIWCNELVHIECANVLVN